MDTSFLQSDISDQEKHTKLLNLEQEYLDNIKKLNILIHEYEIKMVRCCEHEWIVEREPGQYGSRHTYCKKCRLDKNGRYLH
uniref:Uncharacterized protein n=1 Tax=viral metagenome TaxID=1070528 RepID=A0A6C0C6P0_9ZZZZ